MSTPVRTFGGWRERRGFGVGGLSGPQTAGALGAVLTCMLVALLKPSALVVMAVPLLLGMLLVGVRVRGEPVAAAGTRHARFHWARRRGRLSHRSATTGALPGVLSDLQILDVSDSQGRSMGLAWSPTRRTVTAVVPVEPLGPELVESEDVEGWVHGWSDWLTHLGYVSEVEHVSVTIRTGSPNGARTVVGLTVGGAGESALPRATAAISDVVSGMGALGTCGLSVLDPLTADGLALWVRSGFRVDVPDASGLTTADMRPTATEEDWDRYRHDDRFSTVFAWQEPPDTAVTPADLARFLGPAQYVKTVTVVYSPTPAHAAAQQVDRQTQAALFRREYRRRLGRDESAKDAEDLRRAQHTAQEQAAGAGLVDVALFVVVTAEDRETLAVAAADMENRAGQARLRLRRSYGDQARAFAAALGVGYVPARWW